MEDKEERPAMSISSFVLGIISILSALFYYISIPTGVLAIVFGAKTIKLNSKMGRAGLVLGIIGLSLCALIYLFMITGIIYSNY